MRRLPVRAAVSRMLVPAVASALLAAVLFWLTLLLLARRTPPPGSALLLTAILLGVTMAVLVCIHRPLLLAIERLFRARRPLWPQLVLALLLSPAPVLAAFLLFRETGDSLWPLSRIELLEAVPWVIAGAGAGLAFVLLLRRSAAERREARPGGSAVR